MSRRSDTEEYVRYLLQGSGAEDRVDFAALRKELDLSQSPSISHILPQSTRGGDATKSYADEEDTRTRPRGKSYGDHADRVRAQASFFSKFTAIDEFTSSPITPSARPARRTKIVELGRKTPPEAAGSDRAPSREESVSESHQTFARDSERAQSARLNTASLRSETAPLKDSGRGGESSELDKSLRTAETRNRREAEENKRNSQMEETVRPPKNGESKTENTERSMGNVRGDSAIGSKNVSRCMREGRPTTDRPHASGLSSPTDDERLDDAENELARTRPAAPSSSKAASLASLRPLPDAGKGAQEISLQAISTALIEAGFSPLHSSLLFASINPSGPNILNERQAEAIQSALSSVLKEFARRGEVMQNLVDRVTEAEEQRNRWHDKAKEAMKHREEGVEGRAMSDLHDALKSSMSQTATLTAELAASRAEAAELRARNLQLKKRLDEEEKVVERIKLEMADMVEKAEKNRARNERTFASITGQHRRNPQHSGIDRLTLEVIEVYEEKLQSMRDEMNKLRREMKSLTSDYRRSTESVAPLRSTREVTGARAYTRDRQASKSSFSSAASSRATRGAVDLDDEISLRGRGRWSSRDHDGGDDYNDMGDDEGRLGRLRRAMGQQINALQARLEATTSALRESQKETDLLKLQLLATKKADWAARKQDRANRLTTRDLIRRDKQAWKLKLYKIDAMSLEECQGLLKDVCVKLEINDVQRLESALDAIEAIVRLVPQMEEFIYNVDEAVWVHQTRFLDNEDYEDEVHGERMRRGEGNRNSRRKKGVPKRLPETIQVVRGWAQSMGDVEVLKDFRTRIHVLLRVPERAGSDETCFSELRRLLQGQGGRTPAGRGGRMSETPDVAQQAVNHFRDLFEVRTAGDVVAKMNDLYVFWAEVQAGLVRLRDTLKLDDNVQPGRVLARAAEAVASLQEFLDSVRSANNLNNLNTRSETELGRRDYHDDRNDGRERRQIPEDSAPEEWNRAFVVQEPVTPQNREERVFGDIPRDDHDIEPRERDRVRTPQPANYLSPTPAAAGWTPQTPFGEGAGGHVDDTFLEIVGAAGGGSNREPTPPPRPLPFNPSTQRQSQIGLSGVDMLLGRRGDNDADVSFSFG